MISKLTGTLKKIAAVVPVEMLLFLFFFCVYSFTIYGRLRYGDETERYLQAQSLVERQSWAIRPVPAHSALGADGKTYYSQFELGYGLLLVPFYAAGKIVSDLFSIPSPTTSPMLFMSFANPILTALTCVVLFRFSRFIGVQTRTAVVVTIIFGLGTLALPYTRGLYREATQALALLLAVYALFVFQKNRHPRWLFSSGLAFGFLAFTKISNLAMLPIFLLYLGFLLSANDKQNDVPPPTSGSKFLQVSLFLLPIIVLLVIQGIVNQFKFGSFFDIGPYNYKDPLPFFSLSTIVSGVWGLLFSLEKGLFVYAPPTILFLLSWASWFRVDRRGAVFALSLILINILYNGAYRLWEGGTYWGTRYLVLIVPLMLLPIGLTIDSWRGQKRIVFAGGLLFVFLVGFGIQILGAAVGDRDYLDVTGKWIQVPGAFDFFRHGAIDSLFVYLQPNGLTINLYGWALIAFTVLLGIWLWRITQTNAKRESSLGAGIIVWLLTWTILLGLLITQVLSVYPRVLSGQGDTRFVAAETFLENQRYCEARNLYLASLYFGTDFAPQVPERIEAISPRAVGLPIEIGTLMASIESDTEIEVEYDARESLSNVESLRIGAPAGKLASGATLTEFIQFKPQTRYELTGWLKVSNINEGNAVVAWYEDDGRWRNPLTIDLINLTGTSGWQLLRKEITTLPTTRRGIIKIGLWHASGTLWIEGIRLVEIDARVPVRALCNP
jgi:hypothetical protein